MVAGGMSCIKYILFVFNFIFVIFGGLLIYTGILILQDQAGFKDIVETPHTIACTVIVLGCLIFLIAFLGCCGAIVESHCILLAFGVIVTVILALELGLAGLAFTFKAELRSVSSKELKEALVKYNWTDPDARYTKMIDQVQGSLKCCGVNSMHDWPEVNPNLNDRNILPDSCCPHRTADPSISSPSSSPMDTLIPGRSASGSCRLHGSPLASSSNSYNHHSHGFDSPAAPVWNSNPDMNREFIPPTDSVHPIDGGIPVNHHSLSASALLDTTTHISPSDGSAGSGSDVKMSGLVFGTNCVDTFSDTVVTLIGPLGLACLAVGLFQVLGIVFAFALSRAVKREYQVV